MKFPAEILDCFHLINDFWYPDWDRIDSLLQAHFPDNDPGQLWTLVVKEWLERMTKGESSGVTETKNLVILDPYLNAPQTPRASSLESSAQTVQQYLGKSATIDRIGKLAVLIFPDSISYFGYIAEYYAEGSVTPMSGGLCLTHTGYVHLAMYYDPDIDLNPVFVHELTHAYLSHLPLPAWMHEAVAMRMENLVAHYPQPPFDREIYERHRAHWNKETLQQFVTGESWEIPGESFELSYQLAEIIWKKIETNLEATQDEVQELLCTASWQDGGEAALQNIFGIGLNDLFKSFLGEISPA